jgi:hypothetical protein
LLQLHKPQVSLEIATTVDDDKSYSFRLPNHEVASSYKNDCFRTLFNAASDDELKAKGKQLKQGFIARDPQTVSTIVKDFLSTVTYYQRTKDEKTYHAFVQL